MSQVNSNASDLIFLLDRYKRVLNEMYSIFIEPLSNRDRPIINEWQFHKLFRNLNEIHRHLNSFSMSSNSNSNSNSISINHFMNHHESLYSIYLQGHSDSIHLLKSLYRSNARFFNFCQKSKKDLREFLEIPHKFMNKFRAFKNKNKNENEILNKLYENEMNLFINPLKNTNSMDHGGIQDV